MPCFTLLQFVSMFQLIHCKKRLAIFLSPAGMSLIKLSLAGNYWIFPDQGEFGKWHLGWGREKPLTFFCSVHKTSPHFIKQKFRQLFLLYNNARISFTLCAIHLVQVCIIFKIQLKRVPVTSFEPSLLPVQVLTYLLSYYSWTITFRNSPYFYNLKL